MSSILSALVPLLAVAALGAGLGYRPGTGLGGFLLVWATVIVPLAIAIGLGGYFACDRLRLRALRHFALGGFLVGSMLSLGWFGSLSAQGARSALFAVALSAIAGVVGASTSAVFWHLAVRERAG